MATSALEPEHDSLRARWRPGWTRPAWLPSAGRPAGRLERYSLVAHEIGLAPANVRVLARGASRAITLDDSTPEELPTGLRELANAFRALEPYLEGDQPDAVREHALRAAGLANAVLKETANLSALHLVGQLRLIAVDVLRATGLTREEALEAVRAA